MLASGLLSSVYLSEVLFLYILISYKSYFLEFLIDLQIVTLNLQYSKDNLVPSNRHYIKTYSFLVSVIYSYLIFTRLNIDRSVVQVNSYSVDYVQLVYFFLKLCYQSQTTNYSRRDKVSYYSGINYRPSFPTIYTYDNEQLFIAPYSIQLFYLNIYYL